MRFNGHNLLAILAAAVAIYLLEFVLFAVIISAEQYMAMIGVNADQLHPDRMPYGVIPPILAAIGLSLAVKWRNASGLMGGLTTGVLMAVFFSIAARMYGWVYSFDVNELLYLDSLHFVLTHAVAGAILGAWK